MNLTYEVQGKGYTILNDGKPWIVQDSYIPYPADTIEESAQNHIDTIISEMNSPQEPDEVEQLGARLDATEQMLLQIMMEGMV